MTRETVMSVLTIVGMAIAGVSYVNSLERRIAVLEIQLAENVEDDAKQEEYINRLWVVVRPPSLRPAESEPKPSE